MLELVAVFDDALCARVVETELTEIRTAVKPPEVFSFTITGRSADIPVRIENTGPTPLKVALRLTAEKLNFPSDLVEATLEPNTVTVVSVPVTARSNGIFPVQTRRCSPQGLLPRLPQPALLMPTNIDPSFA